jgi:hypothetical protein
LDYQEIIARRRATPNSELASKYYPRSTIDVEMPRQNGTN